MRTISSLLRNSSLSLATNIVTKASSAIVFILVARSGGADNAGIFSLGTTYLAIFVTLTWGLDELLVRQVGRYNRESGRYFWFFLTFRLLLSIISFGLLVGWIKIVMNYSSRTTIIILMIGISLIPDSLSRVGQALLAAYEKFDVPLVAGILLSLIRLVGAGFFVWQGKDLVFLGLIWIASSSAGMVITLFAAYRMIEKIDNARLFDIRFITENLHISIPFVSLGLLLALEYQTDTVILSAVKGETVVGWYGAVTTIVFGLIMISQGFQAAVYPIMVRYHKTDPEKLNFLFDESLFYLGALSLPMAMGLSILSKPIILMIYKEQFLGAVLPLQIMAWLLVSEFLKVPNTRIMLVVEKQKHLVFFLVGSVVLNILINLILDPRLGAGGASIARLSSSIAFLLVNMGYVARRVHHHNIFKILWKPFVATICMGAILLLIQEANLWFVISCGIIVYFVVLYLLRGLSEVEKVWIKSILNRARLVR